MNNLRSLVTQIGPAHADRRRDLWEPINDFPMRRVNAFDFHGSMTPSGNHYHKVTEEVFFVLRGNIKTLLLENVRTREREVFHDLGFGTRISVPSYTAHTLVFAPGTIMIAGCSTAYDPHATAEANDLNDYPLMDERGNVLPSPSELVII